MTAADERIRSVVAAVWPASVVGEALDVDVGVADGGPLHIRVVHLGPPLGPPLGADAVEMLRRSLEGSFGRSTELVDVSVAAGPLTRRDGDPSFAAAVSAGLSATRDVESISVCVVRPAEPEKDERAPGPDAELAKALDEALAAHPRVTFLGAGQWSVQFVHGDCPMPAGDGGTPDSTAADAAIDAPAAGGSDAGAHWAD